MSRIHLHPDHGLNPSLDVCFWCGEARGVAILGYNRGKKAPHNVMTSFEPCDACAKAMAQGITIVEARPARHDEPQIQRGLTPTGAWCVVLEEAVRRLLVEPALSDVLSKRKAFMDPETWDAVGLPRETFDNRGTQH